MGLDVGHAHDTMDIHGPLVRADCAHYLDVVAPGRADYNVVRQWDGERVEVLGEGRCVIKV